jgi:hypothetical protein
MLVKRAWYNTDQRTLQTNSKNQPRELESLFLCIPVLYGGYCVIRGTPEFLHKNRCEPVRKLSLYVLLYSPCEVSPPILSRPGPHEMVLVQILKFLRVKGSSSVS